MSLTNRLMSSIALVLLLVTVIGGLASYWQAVRRVEVETSAAMAQARSTIEAALDDAVKSADPHRELAHLIRLFDDSRHVRAFLIGRNVVEASTLPELEVIPPDWFVSGLSPEPRTSVIELPRGFAPSILVRIQAEPRGELGELWTSFKLNMALLAGLFALLCIAVHITLRRALSPLPEIVSALAAVGNGNYAPRMPLEGAEELRRIGIAGNSMAERLGTMDRENHRLNEELAVVREAERSDLARDLHDGFGPLLFAVDIDAMAIEEKTRGIEGTDLSSRAAAIRAAASEMKAHVAALLAKLRPEVAMELGLGHAIEQLVAACRSRHPEIDFAIDVPAVGWSRDIDAVIYYVVRESLNNALRHAEARRIEVLAEQRADGTIVVRVEDDGRGLGVEGKQGYGILGMSERVAAVDGEFFLANCTERPGVVAEAHIPAPNLPSWLGTASSTTTLQ